MLKEQVSVLTLVEDCVIELNWHVIPGVLQSSSMRCWRINALNPNARLQLLKSKNDLKYSCYVVKRYLLIW